MTQSYNSTEEIMEWLQRHKIPMEGDKYVFYHGTPVYKKLTELRSGSLLAETAEEASHFAARDRGLFPRDIIVHKILVAPDDINVGIFASLNKSYKL